MGHEKFNPADGDAKILAHKNTPDAHHNKIHGIAEHTDVSRTLFIPANQYGNGSLTDILSYSAYLLTDKYVKQCKFTFQAPSDYVSDGKVELIWTSTAAAGNIYFQFMANFARAGEPANNYTFAGDKEAHPTRGANYINKTENTSEPDFTTLEKGDFVGIIVQRDAVDPLDTLNAAVKVLGILFTYTAEQ